MSDTLKAGTIKLFAIRLAGKGLAFFLFWLLAKNMTIHSYGELMYLLSWIAIVIVVSPLGLDILSLRYANVFISENKYQEAKGIYQFSSWISPFVGSLLAILLISYLYSTTSNETLLTKEVAISIFTIITLTAYMTIRRHFLLSLKKPIPAEIPEVIIRPLLVIILLIGTIFLIKTKVTTSHVISIIAISWIIITIGGKLWFNQQVRFPNQTKAIYKPKPWITTGLPIMVVSLGFTSMAEIDIIILTNIGSIEDSAIYSVATRYMQIFSLPLGVMQSISASSLALHHQKGEKEKYSLLASNISKISFLIAIPILIVIVFFSSTLLSFFGESYKTGSIVLVMLASLATINAWLGSTGYSLTMTGKQKILAKLILAALTINIILDMILIPILGIEGAAIATAISVIGWNSFAMLYVWRKFDYQIIWIPFLNHKK